MWDSQINFHGLASISTLGEVKMRGCGLGGKLMQGVEKLAELRGCVEVARRDADGAVWKRADGFVGIRGAMQAGADGNAKRFVEDAAGFLRCVALDVEA